MSSRGRRRRRCLGRCSARARDPAIINTSFVLQWKTKKKVFCIPEWLGIGAVLQNTHVTAQDLRALDHELGEDEREIEGEIQALEDQNKLDTDDRGPNTDWKKKQVSRGLSLVVVCFLGCFADLLMMIVDELFC